MFLPKIKAKANFKLKEIRNFQISVSSCEGKSNPHIHIPAITRVVRLGPEVSEILSIFNL